MNIDTLHPSGPALVSASTPVPDNNAAENRELIQAVKAVNGSELLGQDQELTFTLDRETRRPVVRLVNVKTKEVVRQIPPETVLRMAQDLPLVREKE